MSNETVFIQQLLAAEKRAKEVIESARKSRRIKRIHQAQTEAKEEIESIRQELEKKFQVYESECIRSSNEISHKIKQETMQYLRQMIRDASKNRQAVISQLIELVTNVPLQFHRNFRLQTRNDQDEFESTDLYL